MKTNSDTTTKLYVGFDVHKEKTSLAIADPGATGEIRSYGEVATTQIALERTLRKIAKARGVALAEIHVCYEAGGCGMWIARMLVRLKVQCTVVAPSLIPSKAGDQVKTDKRDAIKLVRLLRAGELTAVHIPDETDEAIRDLCRARVDAIDDLRRVKNRLLAMLRRLGFRYTGKTTWTEAHKRYLRNLRLPFACHCIIMEELIGQIDQLVARIERFEGHMELMCAEWVKKPVVEAIMTLRGFRTIAAMTVVSEIGDFVRFTHPKQLMSYLGLTPGEYSSGGKRKQGSITKCGNSHLRWMLVECATHYQAEPRVSSALSKRQEGQPRWLKEISWKAQNRLHLRFTKLRQRLMHHNKIKVTVARELTGVLWEIGVKMQTQTA
ncbi:MAG: IS110 family transposase [Verrucomicrobiota bacterium]|jgi:transposase